MIFDFEKVPAEQPECLQRSEYKRSIFVRSSLSTVGFFCLFPSSAMARTLLILAGVSSLAALINAQCATSDNANCANWKRNGFCTNPGYAKSMLQQYCPNACKEQSGCGTPDPVSPGTGTNTKPEENANCVKWAEDATKMFCASVDIKPAQKETFCKKTCAAEIAKTDECALYLNKDSKITRSAAFTNDAAAKPTTAADPITIAAIYAKDKCTVKLYADEAPTDLTAGILQEFLGTADVVTAKIVDAAKAAKGMTCTCA